MKCPYCNKPTADIGKKCVHCGKDICRSTERINTVPVKCPLCNTKTEIINLAGVELDYCYKCSGIWFDKGELKKFQDSISNQELCSEMIATLKELSSLKEANEPNQHMSRTDYMSCPVCSQPMLHKKFAEVSGIILDRCAKHGTWTEQEDLSRILEIIHSGEIEQLLASVHPETSIFVGELVPVSNI